MPHGNVTNRNVHEHSPSFFTGRSNTYHINSNSDLAVTYNDISVLENFHCRELFRILKKTDCNFIGMHRWCWFVECVNVMKHEGQMLGCFHAYETMREHRPTCIFTLSHLVFVIIITLTLPELHHHNSMNALSLPRYTHTCDSLDFIYTHLYLSILIYTHLYLQSICPPPKSWNLENASSTSFSHRHE